MSTSNEYVAGMSAAEANSIDTGSQETDYGAQAAQQSQISLEQTAEYLASKATDTTAFGTGADTETELALQQVQMRLHREGPSMNPLERMSLENKATQLAASLVGGNVPTQKEFNEQWEDQDPAGDLVSQYGQQTVDETLQWAGSTLSPEVSEELNSLMAANDEHTYETFEGLRRLQQNPGVVNTGEIGAFDLAVANELAESYGEAGEQLAAINAALCAGTCTRSQAAKMVMGNSKLAMCALSASQSGLIQLAL